MAPRMSIDEYYMNMLALVANRSTCVRRAVGAIITDSRGRVLSTGYNGVPSGIEHCTDFRCKGAGDDPGDTSSCIAVHAEQNALLQCTDLTRAFKLYASCTPCFTCAKMIANTDIKRIVTASIYADTRGQDVLVARGVTVELFTRVPRQMTGDELKSVGRIHFERLSENETRQTLRRERRSMIPPR